MNMSTTTARLCEKTESIIAAPETDAELKFKRVFIVNGSYCCVSDGSIQTLRRLADYLRAASVEVTILCGSSPVNDETVHADRVISVPSLPLPFEHEYRLPFGLTDAARREILSSPDTLLHLGAPDTLAVSCLRLAEKCDLPVVTSFHSNIVSYFKFLRLPRVLERAGWRYFRWFYGKCDQTYVPTESIRRELERNGVRANYLPWPRGVDGKVFSPRFYSDSWRAGLGVAPDDIVVLFVARLKWEKNLEMLRRVVSRLHDASPSVRTVVVGDGTAYDELTRTLPDTRFTGHLSGEALSTAYASADIFLYPSTTDTFGNVTLEAMASGLPTVCADAPGSRSLVDNGTTGYLANPDSVEDFSEKVMSLVKNKVLRRNMSRAALERSRHYEWDNAMRLISGYYNDLYNARQTRPGIRDRRSLTAVRKPAGIPK